MPEISTLVQMAATSTAIAGIPAILLYARKTGSGSVKYILGAAFLAILGIWGFSEFVSDVGLARATFIVVGATLTVAGFATLGWVTNTTPDERRDFLEDLLTGSQCDDHRSTESPQGHH